LKYVKLRARHRRQQLADWRIKCYLR